MLPSDLHVLGLPVITSYSIHYTKLYEDVCDYIIEAVGKVLDSAPITYVKWDMNRHMTEVGSALLPAERQRETAHRYMLGLYRVMDALVTRFPHILFESCSGGGGRFDPGILYYMPQTWTT